MKIKFTKPLIWQNPIICSPVRQIDPAYRMKNTFMAVGGKYKKVMIITPRK